MNRIVLCGVSLLMLQACSDAKKASEVTAAYVPSSAYSSMSCNNLRAEDLRLRRSVTEMSGVVDKEYSNDKNMEVVVVVHLNTPFDHFPNYRWFIPSGTH